MTPPLSHGLVNDRAGSGLNLAAWEACAFFGAGSPAPFLVSLDVLHPNAM